MGLRAALKELCEQVSARLSAQVDLQIIDVSLPSDVQFCFYRIAQEALNNVLKHSRTGRIAVSLSRDSGLVRLRVKDSGVGFDTTQATTGIGLVSMRERLRIVRGALLVSSHPGQGTEIIAEVPFAESAEVAKAS